MSAGVLAVDRDRVSFTHPLLASEVYARLGPERRRAVHRLLAEAVEESEQRATHLALATSEPDEGVAALVEAGSSHARSRGALDASGALLEHAARLTPPHLLDGRARRQCAAADRFLNGGDPLRARAVLHDVLASYPAGPLRGEALTLLGWIEDDLPACVRLAEEALAEAGGAARVEAHARYLLAMVRSIQTEFEEVVHQAALAASLGSESGEPELEAMALAQLGHARTFLGHGVTEESRRAAELDRASGFAGQGSGCALLGRVLMFTGRLDEARSTLTHELERATASGHDGARATLMHDLSMLELRAGKLAAADELAVDSSRLAHQVATDQMSASSLYFPALVDAVLGRVEPARARARQGLETAERIGDLLFAMKHRGVLGFVELSVGDPRSAHAWLEPATRRLIEANVQELTTFEVVENQLDALVTLGRVEEADALVRWVESIDPRSSIWNRALAARGRGLVDALRGDLDGARESFDRALALHDTFENPFEHARTLLIRGALERREKRKSASREFLRQALALFECLPAPLWAEKARAELRRLSLRSAPSTLTATESRIAELAAAGLTNREIAAAVFVSQKTVEANLSKIYRKLAVRSRVDLARRLARDEPGGPELAGPP